MRADPKNWDLGVCWTTNGYRVFGRLGLLKTRNPAEFLELYALTAGLLTWNKETQLNNNRIVIFCDNQAVVQMINDMSSGCSKCMRLLRILTLDGLRHNRRVGAKFVPTKLNGLADALSRGQWSRFRKLGPHMNENPDVISTEVWPVWKVWENN